jgi:transcriptional regulator with XRE-family HTH domain
MDMAAGDPLEQDFRSFLQDELEKRCKKNPRFSLRAFARTLDVEPSALSKILHGKRSLTPKMLLRMASQLGLPDNEIERFAKKHASGNRGHFFENAVLGQDTNQPKTRHHKSIDLELSAANLKVAVQLTELFISDLNKLALSESGLDAKEILAVDVFMRSEKK